MRLPRVLLPLLALGLLLAAPVRADEAKLARLLDLVGYDASLESLAASIGSAADGPLAAGSPGEKAAFRRLVAEHFDPAEMRADVAAAMAGEIAGDDLDALIAFFEDDLGRRATALEVAAQAPERAAEKDAVGPRLAAEIADSDPDRLALYNRIIAAMDAVENGVAVGLNVTYAMISGMAGSPQMPFALSDEQILGIVKTQEPAIRAAITERLIGSLAYTYRDMEEADLAAYVAFLEGPLGQALYRPMNRATESMLIPRARAFGHAVMVAKGLRDI